MPIIRLRNACGQEYRLDTLDLDKVGFWLAEWVSHLCSGDPAMPPLQLEVWPLYDRNNKPDLPLTDAYKVHELTEKGIEEFVRELRADLRIGIGLSPR